MSLCSSEKLPSELDLLDCLSRPTSPKGKALEVLVLEPDSPLPSVLQVNNTNNEGTPTHGGDVSLDPSGVPVHIIRGITTPNSAFAAQKRDPLLGCMELLPSSPLSSQSPQKGGDKSSLIYPSSSTSSQLSSQSSNSPSSSSSSSEFDS